MSSTIDQLKQKIDEKHRAALAALEVLKDYLADEDSGSLPLRQEPLEQPAGRNGHTPPLPMSNRSRVLGILRSRWATVRSVQEETSLSIRQIRGVLNSPGIREHLSRRHPEGSEIEYRVEDEGS